MLQGWPLQNNKVGSGAVQALHKHFSSAFQPYHGAFIMSAQGIYTWEKSYLDHRVQYSFNHCLLLQDPRRSPEPQDSPEHNWAWY